MMHQRVLSFVLSCCCIIGLKWRKVLLSIPVDDHKGFIPMNLFLAGMYFIGAWVFETGKIVEVNTGFHLLCPLIYHATYAKSVLKN